MIIYQNKQLSQQFGPLLCPTVRLGVRTAA